MYRSVLYEHGHGFSILFFFLHRYSYDGCWHQRIHFYPELGLLKLLFEFTGHAHFAHLRKASKTLLPSLVVTVTQQRRTRSGMVLLAAD